MSRKNGQQSGSFAKVRNNKKNSKAPAKKVSMVGYSRQNEAPAEPKAGKKSKKTGQKVFLCYILRWAFVPVSQR